ncbi:MAG TPA: ATP-binding protein [Chitinophagaceae bacterium]|nr:ATP-binding protein [Chitinophagaceae bacterium]
MGCRPDRRSEPEAQAFWDSRVIQPAETRLYGSKELKSSLALFDSLTRKAGVPDPYLQAQRYRFIANYHLFITKNDAATACYIDSGLAVLDTEDLQESYPRTYVHLLLFGGEMQFRLGHSGLSNRYFFQAKQWADRMLDPCARSSFTYNAAMVSYRQENFAQALAYFREAFRDQSRCPTMTTAIALQHQEILSNIGLCLVRLRRYDSAAVCFAGALQLAEQYRDSLGDITLEKIRGVVYGHLGKVAMAQGQLLKADSLIRQSVALNSRPGYENHHALGMQVDLAELYQRRGKAASFEATLTSIRYGLDTLPDEGIELSWRRLRYERDRDFGPPGSELASLKQYIRLKDTVEERRRVWVQADISRQLQSQEQAYRITALTRENEVSNHLLWASIALSGMGGIILVLIYQNYRRSKRHIRELKHFNETVSQQKAALEQSNREKDRILHVVAHDLRNPIGLTAYVSEMVLMEELEPKTRGSLQMIREAAQQALHLTDELLGQRTGPEALSRAPLDLVRLVRAAVEQAKVKAAEKGQTLSLSAGPEDLWVQADPVALNRVLVNLLANAIKFSPQGAPIEVLLQREDNRAACRIQDRGVGIAPGDLPLVFDRFTAARRPGTGGEKSFGLGLSICRELLTAHGGSIELGSRAGGGTEVLVTLPLMENV